MNEEIKKPFVPSRVADINAEIARTGGIASTGVLGGDRPYVPNIPPTINSNTLNPSQTPIQIPEQNISTQPDRIIGRTTAILANDTLEQQAEQEKLKREAELKASENKQKSILEQIGFNKQTETTKGNEEFGLDVLKEKRKDAIKAMRESQITEQEELKAVANQSMLTDIQKANRRAEIRSRYALEQNQYQLDYDFSNSDIVAAQKTIDERISLLNEPLYAQLDLTKNVYNQISDSLTKSEDRLWNLKINEVENTISEKNKIGEFAKTVAANGADASTISRVTNAKTMAEAIQNAGQYAGKVTSVGGGVGVADASVEYYSQLLAEGKITLSNVPQSVRNAVVANSQGIINKPLSDTALSKINDTNFAISSLNDLRAKIQTNLGQLGPITGLQALNPYSEKRKLQADIDRVRQTVGKALEGGVLRKEDEEKYKNILATITDTPETALYKIDALISSIQRNIEDYKSLQSESGRFVPTKTGTVAPEDLRAKYNY